MNTNKKITKQYVAEYQAMIQKAFPPGHKEHEGIFGPGSMHWKLYREPGILVASYRALMLQVAHPAVADGVRQFSAFKKDYLGRAERTFTNMINIYYGDRQTALNTAFGLYRMHGSIRGTILRKDGGRNQIHSYCANDPELLLWVLATMVEATINAYEQTCRALTPFEKQQFYEESKRTATLMGIPPELYPKDINSFYNYFQNMIDSDVLRVDEVSDDLAEAIFKPPYFPSYLARTLAAGGLPSRWRKAYGLSYTKGQRKTYNLIVRFLKVVRKITPHPFGYAPPWYQAHYRVARANGQNPLLIDSFFNWVAKSPYLKAVTLSSRA